MKKLNIGSGEDYREDYINLDIRKNIKKDIEWDFNNFPYPLKSDFFDEVLLRRSLEHAEDPIKVLRELVRICKNKAKIKIQVAHAFSLASYADLQHHSFYTKNTFSEKQLREYDLEQLKLTELKFVFLINIKNIFHLKDFSMFILMVFMMIFIMN